MHRPVSAFIVFALACIPWSTPIHAATICREGDLIRIVTVVYSDPGSAVPCEVTYEKPAEGFSMTLWRANDEVGFCEAQAKEFLNKMSALGWHCEPEPDHDSAKVQQESE